MRDVSLPPNPTRSRRKRNGTGWLVLFAVLHALQAAPLLLLSVLALPESGLLFWVALPHAAGCLGLVCYSPGWWRVAVAAETLLLCAFLGVAALLSLSQEAASALALAAGPVATVFLIQALLPFTALLMLLRPRVRARYALSAHKR